MISADIAASVVIREVSNNEQFFILLWLLIRCAEGYNLPRYHYSSHCIRLLWFPLPMYFSTHTCRWRCLRLSLNLFLKIYRCWIVWGCNTHVVIIPSILAIGFLGLPSAKLSSFTYWLKFIASSYLGRRTECCPRLQCRRSICSFWPEEHTGHHQSRHVDERECSGNVLNCVQDLQSIPRSQIYYHLGREFFGHHWRDKTLVNHVHHNWIRHGVVYHPVGSGCG